jgi:hypothetical protein
MPIHVKRSQFRVVRQPNGDRNVTLYGGDQPVHVFVELKHIKAEVAEGAKSDAIAGNEAEHQSYVAVNIAARVLRFVLDD